MMNLTIMDNQKEYTQSDLETAKKIVTIDGNVNGLTKDMEEVKKTMKEGFDKLNNSYESVKTLISEVFSMTRAHDGEIKTIKLEMQGNKLKQEGDMTALSVRVTALETTNTTENTLKDGEKHLWRNILAVIGFIGLATGTLGGIIAVIQKVQGII